MSMSNASENNLLNLLFNNVDWANVGDAASAATFKTTGTTTFGACVIRLQ